jgi:hypothetical protein
VVVDPRRRLAPGAAYVVRVRGLADADGNALPAVAWRFTTVDDTAPRVRMVAPRAAAERIARAADLRARFSEAVARVDARSVRVHVVSDDGNRARLRATVRYDADRRLVRIDTRRTLPRDATVTVTFTGRIRDLAGNRLERDQWSFATRR